MSKNARDRRVYVCVKERKKTDKDLINRQKKIRIRNKRRNKQQKTNHEMKRNEKKNKGSEKKKKD